MTTINLNNKFIIKENNETIYATSDSQDVYLYPLTLKDYVDNLKDNLPINLNILETNSKIDYQKLLNKRYFKKLLSVTIFINDGITVDKLDTIKSIILSSYKKHLKITLLIDNICNIPKEFLISITHYIDFFKIYWLYNDYSLFKKQIALINTLKNNNNLLLIKGYLKVEELNNYEKYIKDFISYGVDIYQLSKELIPLNTANIKLDSKVEKTIRSLEKKYHHDFIFMSVKNLKELYYPRFNLDERNSRNCLACHLKPYLYEDILLPCKVSKVLENKKEWGTTNYQKLDNFQKCGSACDDCASIYENDILNEIYDIIKYKKDIITEIERDGKL